MTYSASTSTEMLDYYQLLNLQSDWEVDTLRRELRNVFSGTKARVNAATGKKLEEINLRLKWIIAAKKILLDPDAKEKYDQDLIEWKRTATPEQQATSAAVPTVLELWQMIDDGRYLDAVEAGKRLVNQQTDSDKAWEAYAYACYHRSDMATAVYAAEQAIRCNPQNAEYYADAGQYLASANRWDEASQQINRAIQLEPSNTGYRLVLSDIYMKHQLWPDAQAVLQGVLSQEPSNQTARSFMAIVIGSQAEARFPEIDELIENNKKREARKLLKEVYQQFEEANNLSEGDPELRELLSSESFLVRRVLGVNFYRRIMGVFVDSLLMLPAFLLMTIDNGSNFAASSAGVLVMLVILGYSWIWLALKNNGQDLTKRLLGLQIISDSDSLPSLTQLIGRAVCKPIAIGLGGLFPFLILTFSMISVMAENSSWICWDVYWIYNRCIHLLL
jgi:tetratricopeptide (TPR) repeat protein